MASNILGTKTGDFLTWFTIILVGVFLLLGVLMAKYYKSGASEEFDTEMPVQTQVPAEQPQIPVDIEKPTIPSEGVGTENIADINLNGD